MSQPSSPVLKARRQTHKLYSTMLYSILCFCFTVWLFRLAILRLGKGDKIVDQGRAFDFKNSADDGRSDTHEGLLGDVPRADALHSRHSNHSTAPQHSSSLTIILPVTSASIVDLNSHLHSLFRPSRMLVEVVLLSPRRYHPQIRKSLRNILSRTDDLELEFSVAQWLEGTNEGAAVIMAAQRATTDWVLLADVDGFSHFDATTRDYLLLNKPPHAVSAIGPRGMVSNLGDSACLVASSLPQQASYLVPPLVLPTSLLPDTLDNKYTHEPWVALGEHISHITSDFSGGTVLGSPDLSSSWCIQQQHEESPSVDLGGPQSVLHGGSTTTELGSFAMLVYESDLPHISPMACGSARQGHDVKVLVVGDIVDVRAGGSTHMEECSSLVTVEPLPTGTLQRSGGEFRRLVPHKVDVLISAVEEDVVTWFLMSFGQMHSATDAAPTDIRIPREDLPYCDWMTAVDLDGWKSGLISRMLM